MAHTRKQLITLVVFSVAQFCNAVCVSLQAPFYPSEAEKKGATATQYGLVFGIFELTVFLVSPIYGKFLNKIGAKFINNAGIFTVSVMSILFGFLDRIDDTNTFIGMSFAIRIVEALGNAAFVTSAFSIVAKEFPKNVGGAFATMETFFGLGLIAGPTVGGALYELGGYTLPFVSLGIVLLLAATFTCCMLPATGAEPNTSESSRGSLFAALRLPSILLAIFSILSTSISIGFLQATLEPHMRPLGLTPFQMGLMFVLNGATYAVSAPCWGWLCDRWLSPRSVTAFGAVTVAVAFLFVGPVPFLPIDMSLSVIVCALIVHGVGMGAELVSTFTGAHRDAIANGFPDDLSTYGLISGIWTSAFALGCFIGPSVGGVLLDHIGFAWSTVIIVALHILVFVSTTTFIWCRRSDNANVYTSINESLSQSKEEQASLVASRAYKYSDRGDRDSTYGSAGSSQEYLPI